MAKIDDDIKEAERRFVDALDTVPKWQKSPLTIVVLLVVAWIVFGN